MMVKFTLEDMNITRRADMGNSYGLMEHLIKEYTLMIKRKDGVLSFGQTKDSTKDNGAEENNQELENLSLLMEDQSLVFGIKEIDKNGSRRKNGKR